MSKFFAQTSGVRRDKRKRILFKKNEGFLIATQCLVESNFSEKMKEITTLYLCSLAKVRNRCLLTGRSASVYSKFRLSRIKLREAAMRGDVPGLKKASW